MSEQKYAEREMIEKSNRAQKETDEQSKENKKWTRELGRREKGLKGDRKRK